MATVLRFLNAGACGTYTKHHALQVQMNIYSELLQLLLHSATNYFLYVAVYYYWKELYIIARLTNQEMIKSPAQVSWKSFIIHGIQEFSINLVILYLGTQDTGNGISKYHWKESIRPHGVTFHKIAIF